MDKLYYGIDKFNDYEKAKRDNNIGCVPDSCRKHYGEDLDGCSTQQNEGCGRCALYLGLSETDGELDGN